VVHRGRVRSQRIDDVRRRLLTAVDRRELTTVFQKRQPPIERGHVGGELFDFFCQNGYGVDQMVQTFGNVLGRFQESDDLGVHGVHGNRAGDDGGGNVSGATNFRFFAERTSTTVRHQPRTGRILILITIWNRIRQRMRSKFPPSSLFCVATPSSSSPQSYRNACIINAAVRERASARARA